MEPRKKSGVSRRRFLKGAAAASTAAVAGQSIYSVLNEFSGPTRAYAAAPYREEQYLIDGLAGVYDNGVAVVIPPIYNNVFTAKVKLTLSGNKTADNQMLRDAQQKLEAALTHVQGNLPGTAAGLTIVVAWGLPYFTKYVLDPWLTMAPLDMTTQLQGPNYPPGQSPPRDHPLAVLDAIKFDSDPDTVVFEQNDVAFKIRSDSQTILDNVERELFFHPKGPADITELFTLTSKRVGFLGRGFGQTSAAKKLATDAGLPGAGQIPDKSQLMMGFTSTQGDALGPDNIPSFETLRGLTDQWPYGYWAAGTAMHLSHLTIDLASWYGKSYAERVQRMLSPRTPVPTDAHTVTLPNGPANVAQLADVKADALNPKLRLVGHNSALQMATRTARTYPDNYGRIRPQGTPVPAREDFNTIDDPFAWSRDPSDNWVQGTSHKPGLHFAVFVPGSGRFHTARKAMDGLLPDKSVPGGITNLRQPPYNLTDDRIGFNSQMKATHRQNFLVPPRSHRSFPLAELLKP